MAKTHVETLVEQTKARAEALKKIHKCKVSRSKTLKIGDNRNLNTFPEEIRELTWLTSLSVTNTGITELPEWIGELKDLKTLNLSGNNKLKKLPVSIADLQQLKNLNLDNTVLKTLPLLR